MSDGPAPLMPRCPDCGLPGLAHRLPGACIVALRADNDRLARHNVRLMQQLGAARLAAAGCPSPGDPA